ncbi:MAG: hypothetical protein O3C33_10320, partial [Actinomycetota bacterium]|nr:hypothetical protein [Actinomycetota bacterium]
MKPLSKRVAAFGVAASLAIAACGGDDTADEPSEETTEETTATTATSSGDISGTVVVSGSSTVEPISIAVA